jgi:hypothetical protein
MVTPLPPVAFLPPIWAKQATLRDLPAAPGLLPDHACWIENLGAWIATNASDAKSLRQILGTSARVLTPSNLPLPDLHFGTDEQMLAWCEEEGLEPIKDKDGFWDWHTVYEQYLARLDGTGE